jgi:hypothetical protein
MIIKNINLKLTYKQGGDHHFNDNPEQLYKQPSAGQRRFVDSIKKVQYEKIHVADNDTDSLSVCCTGYDHEQPDAGHEYSGRNKKRTGPYFQWLKSDQC